MAHSPKQADLGRNGGYGSGDTGRRGPLTVEGGDNITVSQIGNIVRINGTGGTGITALVWGAVQNDGTVLDGEGFTVSDDGIVNTVEQYTITFDTPFTTVPRVWLTANNNNGPDGSLTGRYTVSLLSVAVDEIVVITANVDDQDLYSGQDGGFDFVAVEIA